MTEDIEAKATHSSTSVKVPTNADRRLVKRNSVFLRATVYPIEVFCDALIHDVSNNGAKGEPGAELAVHQTIHITADQISYHSAVVKWVSGRQFGIDLPDAVGIFGARPGAIDCGYLQEHSARFERIIVNAVAGLVGGRAPRPAIVRNISTGGMLLDTCPGLQQGQHIIVKIGKMQPIYGRTQWCSKGRVGIRTQSGVAGPGAALLAE